MKCEKCEKTSAEKCVDINCPLLENLEDINNKSENDIGVIDESETFTSNGGEVKELPLEE